MVDRETEESFFELVSSVETLIICGAGHIAQPLASMAGRLGFRVVVIDDRPEFASHERFAEVDEVIARPFEEALRSLEIDERTHAVLVTRGHRHDELCLRELLRTKAGYIGMLGSRRRVRAIFRDLEDEGWVPDELSRVWAPIGLGIGAHTPAEIAISILAEIVALRNGGSGVHPHLRGGTAPPGTAE